MSLMIFTGLLMITVLLTAPVFAGEGQKVMVRLGSHGQALITRSGDECIAVVQIREKGGNPQKVQESYSDSSLVVEIDGKRIVAADSGRWRLAFRSVGDSDSEVMAIIRSELMAIKNRTRFGIVIDPSEPFH